MTATEDYHEFEITVTDMCGFLLILGLASLTLPYLA